MVKTGFLQGCLVLAIFSCECSRYLAHASSAGSQTRHGGWSLYKGGYPNPNVDTEKCMHGICDPDMILTISEKEQIALVMAALSSYYVRCEGSTALFSSIVDEEDEASKIEISLALMEKMVLPPDLDEESAAREFAVALHNEWGVGSTSKSCQGDTGILLFFSMRDRVLFLSKGSALESTLTDGRIDRIIESMVPSLRVGSTVNAIEKGLYSVIDILKKGPETRWEKIATFISMYLEYLVYVGGLLVVVISVFWEKRRVREYAEVHSQLSRLDRDQALSLQGAYQCTSCPICLEDFEGVGETADAEGENGDESSSAAEPFVPTHGCDGLPIKLLRCGHVFGETCWKEYLATGHGDIRVCPICKQDVGTAPAASASATTTTETQDRTNELRYRTNSGDSPLLNQNNNARNMTWYQRERQFRLLRLARRFPRYIGRSQLSRWSRDGYQDSLARDRDFVQRDPSRANSNSGSRGGTSSSGLVAVVLVEVEALGGEGADGDIVRNRSVLKFKWPLGDHTLRPS